MPLPTPEEFRELLLAQSLEQTVQEQFFEGEVYAFRNERRALEVLYDHFRRELELEPEQLRIVGSGKIGFSVSPADFPRRFSSASDIDIAIANQALYDQVWYGILAGQYPRRRRLLDPERRSTASLYWGWIAPDRIRFDVVTMPPALTPVHRFSARWFNAFRSLSRYRLFSRREVSGRLYRTWEHARLYHADGLRQLAEVLEAAGGA
jgi:hypothetical protein